MRPTLPARLSRAGFGLLAIWCLGCTSFDLLIDALIRGDGARVACAMPDDDAPVGAGVSVVRSQSSDDSPDWCHCDHCIAVQVDPTSVAQAPCSTPETVQGKPGSALSIEREPLVPPPIASLAI